MRVGRSAAAVQVFREFVLGPGGLVPKKDLPACVVVNFATALLLEQNLEGCELLLAELEANLDVGRSATERLRSVLTDWRRQLTWRQRLTEWLTGRRPAVRLPFPPGDLV
jgi:hypothetical protein